MSIYLEEKKYRLLAPNIIELVKISPSESKNLRMKEAKAVSSTTSITVSFYYLNLEDTIFILSYSISVHFHISFEWLINLL